MPVMQDRMGTSSHTNLPYHDLLPEVPDHILTPAVAEVLATKQRQRTVVEKMKTFSFLVLQKVKPENKKKNTLDAYLSDHEQLENFL